MQKHLTFAVLTIAIPSPIRCQWTAEFALLVFSTRAMNVLIAATPPKEKPR